MRGGGGFGVHLAPLADMLQTARQLAAGLLQAAQPAIERAAEESQSAGRDCAARALDVECRVCVFNSGAGVRG